MAVLEEIRDQIADMGAGHVVQTGVGDTPLRQLGRQDLSGGLSVAIHGGIDNHDTPLLWLIGGPVDVLIDEIAQVPPPHGAMEGADELDVV